MGSQKSNKEDNFNMFVSGKKKQEINVETDMDSFHHPHTLLSLGNPVEVCETVTLQGVTVFYCVAFGDFSPPLLGLGCSIYKMEIPMCRAHDLRSRAYSILLLCVVQMHHLSLPELNMEGERIERKSQIGHNRN